MKNYILDINNLHDLVDFKGLKLFGAERLLENVLPEWINKATSVALKNVLRRYLDFIQLNIDSLKDFTTEEAITKLSRANNVMQSFIIDTREQLSNCTDAEVRDACLLSCIQSINHYKINGYGTVAAFAKALDNKKASGIFHQAKLNEEEIDHTLTQLAKSEINNNARNNVLLPGNTD